MWCVCVLTWCAPRSGGKRSKRSGLRESRSSSRTVLNTARDDFEVKNPLPPLIRAGAGAGSSLGTAAPSGVPGPARTPGRETAAPSEVAGRAGATVESSATSASTPPVPTTPDARTSRDPESPSGTPREPAAGPQAGVDAVTAATSPAAGAHEYDVFALEGAEAAEARDREQSSPLGFVSTGNVSAPTSTTKPRARRLAFEDEKAAAPVEESEQQAVPRPPVQGGGDFAWSAEDKHALVRLSNEGFTATNSVGYAAKVGWAQREAHSSRPTAAVRRAWRATPSGRGGDIRLPFRWQIVAVAPSVLCPLTSPSGPRVRRARVDADSHPHRASHPTQPGGFIGQRTPGWALHMDGRKFSQGTEERFCEGECCPSAGRQSQGV